MLWPKALSYIPIFFCNCFYFLSFSRRSCCYIPIFPLHLNMLLSFSRRTCCYILIFPLKLDIYFFIFKGLLLLYSYISFTTKYTFVIFKEEEAEAASEALLGTLDYVLLVTIIYIYSLHVLSIITIYFHVSFILICLIL